MATLDSTQLEHLERLRRLYQTTQIKRWVIAKAETLGISDHLIMAKEEHFPAVLKMYQQGDK